MSFYSSKEYRLFLVAKTYLEYRKTDGNKEIYQYRKYNAIQEAERNYSNVGYDKDKGTYDWIKKINFKEFK